MSEIRNFDESFCGKLPLHLTNLIQPHGALLVLSTGNREIIQASENIKDFTGYSAQELVNKPISMLISSAEAAELDRNLQSNSASRIPISFGIPGKNAEYLLGLVHSKDDHIIIELERRMEGKSDAFLEFYKQLRYLMAAIEGANSKVEVCNIALKELSKLSGFDRIMIYEFDSQWNGTVIAEQMNFDGLEPYLGLKFPASDVPKPARDLYYKNPYRLIPDRNYTPSKLYPVLNPMAGGFTDLSTCNLRSVASVHIEYLTNMGVTASMSTRIIKDEILWGLISCHHTTPKYLDFEMCSIFELLSNIFSSRLNTLSNKEEYLKRSEKQELHVGLLTQIKSNGLVEGLFNGNHSILELLHVPGAAIVYQNKLHVAGDTPEPAQIDDLVLWLKTNDVNAVFSTSNLSDKHDTWMEFSSEGSGLIVIPFGIAGSDNYVLGFRPEVVRTVDWGGNPNEAVNFENNMKDYHPRSSFHQWKQLVKNTSLPWESYVLDVAERLRSSLLEFTLTQN